MREALGLTLADLSQRLKVTPPAVRSFELAEAEDRITLASLRRTAHAMDCDLVYTFVSRRSAPAISPQPAPEVLPEKVTDLTWHAQRSEP